MRETVAGRAATLARQAQHFFWDRPRLEMPLADQVKFSPLLAQMVVIRRCNLRCGYCSEYDRTSEPVPLPVLCAQVEALRRLGTLAIEFTGGEPLLHPQLPEAIACATKAGFPARMLISNVTLMTPARVEALNDAGLTNLQVSVDGVKPNKCTVKVLDYLRPKLDLLARSARFEILLSAVVGASSPEEVAQVVAYANERGFTPRVLLIHGEQGQLELDRATAACYERVVELLGSRYREGNRYREALLHGRPAPFKCRAGSRYLYVDELGMVRYCSQFAGPNLGPLRDYRPADLRRHFYAHKACNQFCTVGCVRTSSKLDEWRAYGEAPPTGPGPVG
jgi:MoaA/NifB/PqqE/SkfB family radical SAM enzyme